MVSHWGMYWRIVAAAVGVLLVAFVTISVLRYRQGYGLTLEWRQFTAAEGNVQVDLLGRPEQDIASDGSIRFWSRGWYSGVYAYVGWQALNAEQAALARLPDARRQLNPLIESELDRWRQWFGGEGRTATMQFADPLIVEIYWRTATIQGVGRILVVATGSRPRAYFLGIIGPRITPDHAAVHHFFASFHYQVDS
jgi:hypothetical protein